MRSVDMAHWSVPPEGMTWLTQGECQADCLKDLRTKQNVLSFWRIEADRSNLPRVIAALAAGRDHLQKLDYVLAPDSVLGELSIEAGATPGNSPDPKANGQWHLDLIHLSAGKLARLAGRINACGEKKRLPMGKVKEVIRAGLARGDLERGRVQESIVDGLSSR